MSFSVPFSSPYHWGKCINLQPILSGSRYCWLEKHHSTYSQPFRISHHRSTVWFCSDQVTSFSSIHGLFHVCLHLVHGVHIHPDEWEFMENSFKIDLGQSWEIVVLMYMGTYKILRAPHFQTCPNRASTSWCILCIKIEYSCEIDVDAWQTKPPMHLYQFISGL